MTEAVTNLALQLEESAPEAKDVEVLVSYDVVKLFSDQLYPSPLKAVEELVVNSWDADARVCSVLCRLQGDRSVIAVFDNGNGMTLRELEDLWHIGVSKKPGMKADRQLIGKFGIGKLASNAVARRATYISKTSEGIYSVAIDFTAFANATNAEGVPSRVTLKIRHIATVGDLLKLDAFADILDILRGSDEEGVDPESLVGAGLDSVPSWTFVVLEDLKPKASQLSTNRLRWVLQTAMPLASDFKLYLNGNRVDSSKASYTHEVEFEVHELEDERLRSLESVTGQVWSKTPTSITSASFPSGYRYRFVADRSLYAVGGKSQDLGRSHGFFVRVRNRLINETDPLFGARPLSFTTWYNFAAIVEVEDLNDYVTAARDDIENSTIKETLREFLIALFNQARDRYEEKLKKKEERENKDKKEDERDYVSPRLTEKPLADALVDSQDDDDSWEYIEPVEDNDSLQDFLDRLYTQPRSERKYTFRHASAGTFAPLVRMNAVTGTFMINDDHELVQEFGTLPETRRLLDIVAASEAFLKYTFVMLISTKTLSVPFCSSETASFGASQLMRPTPYLLWLLSFVQARRTRLSSRSRSSAHCAH